MVTIMHYTVKLKNDTGLTWVLGEHGIFTLPSKKFEGKNIVCFK